MDPFQASSSQPPVTSSRKKLWLMIAVVASVLLLAVAAAVVFFTRAPQTATPANNQQAQKPASDLFAFGADSPAKTYAGSSVYDACNLISLNTLKKTIPNFTKLLNTVGTDERASNPVMLEHNYIDRDIASPLGSDASPRQPGTVVNEKPGVVSTDPYISLADSSCSYGQTGDQKFIQNSLINSPFAQLYITQKPTPLAPQFLNFVKSQKKFEEHSFKDIDVYPMPTKDSNGYYATLFVKKDQSAAVIFKTGIAALLDAASDDIAAALSKAPTGPLTITYPEPYQQLTDPCSLLSADEFTRFTNKPTGALANEAIFLTEVGSNSIRRECERLEIDRDILKSNITQSRVTLRQVRSLEDAKQFTADEKKNSLYEVTSLKAKIALGDEAYIKKAKTVSALENPYNLVIRKGGAIINLEMSLDKQDASADAFEGRIIPVAQAVLSNFEAAR
ncbi:MAG TPA: hypothetical protein VFZ58_00145 [Candidatus Saccharimonadales bacterium]